MNSGSTVKQEIRNDRGKPSALFSEDQKKLDDKLFQDLVYRVTHLSP